MQDNDSTRYPDNRGMGWNLFKDNGACAYLSMVADFERAENLRASRHHDIIANRRMPFALLLASAAEGHALIKRHVLTKLRRLPDNNSRAVVNEQSVANRRAGVNLYPRQEPAEVRHQPRRDYPAAFKEGVRNSMQPNRVQSRIAQDDLQHALCRRVALKDNANVFLYARKKFHCRHLDC